MKNDILYKGDPDSGLSYSNLDDDPDELQRIGITHSGNTITLSKSLSVSDNGGMFYINNSSDTIIELNDGVTLTASNTIFEVKYMNNKTITIKGNGNTLILNSGMYCFSASASNNKLVLDDVILVASSNQNINICKFKNLELKNGTTLTITNSDSSTTGGSLQVTGTFTQENYEFLGSKTLNPLVLEPATNVSDTFKIDGVLAKYLEVKPKQPDPPTPSPTPSKKDESCEKVIGPTWHWNNDKGICEDYGVVGTSTR